MTPETQQIRCEARHVSISLDMRFQGQTGML